MIVIQLAEMDCWPGVRTRNVYHWFSVIWFISAVSVAGGEDVMLQTIPQSLTSRCGDNVKLTCEGKLSQQDIKLFTWVYKNKSCQYNDHQSELCESTREPLHQSLTLTLLNVMPADQGDYLCKLHSKLGVESQRTVVTVQDCFESSVSSINETQANCCFNGVYPTGIIHWTGGNANMTDSARMQEEQDQYGRYNICSTLDVQRGNVNKVYRCSLWIPSLQKNQESIDLATAEAQESSGCVAKLQGIVLIIEIMTVKFMT